MLPAFSEKRSFSLYFKLKILILLTCENIVDADSSPKISICSTFQKKISSNFAHLVSMLLFAHREIEKKIFTY